MPLSTKSCLYIKPHTVKSLYLLKIFTLIAEGVEIGQIYGKSKNLLKFRRHLFTLVP